MTQPTTELTQVRVAVATARNRRTRNEDAIGLAGWVLYGDRPSTIDVNLLIGPSSPLILAVTDGMGGAPDGHRAARIAAERLSHPRGAPPDTQAALSALLIEADAAIHDEVEGDTRGMGCTAAVVVVPRTGPLLVANVGDVRVYRMVDGYASQLTRDDRVGDARLSQCLGGRHRLNVKPHLYEITGLPGDRFIVCTDGLHDVAGEAIAACPRLLPAGQVAATLMRAAAGGADNATVAVLDLG